MPTNCRWHHHEGPLATAHGDFEVIDCEFCGFKHAIPLPTASEMEQVYRNEYYATEKPLYLEGVKADLDWWQLVYRDRYEEFERQLPEGRRSLLDVGSGPGFFLQFGQQNGWQVLGIEPSKQAAEHARGLGLSIEEGLLDGPLASQLGPFDVVHMNNVLEHIPDPRGMIELCSSMLAPDGLICVVVPNDFNPFQKALTEVCNFQPWWVVPPHHLNFFDFDSLQTLLMRCGFEILVRETTFPIDLFLLMGDNYVGNDELGRACHVKRMTFEKNLATAGLNSVKRELYQALAATGLGREIVLIGRKQPG